MRLVGIRDFRRGSDLAAMPEDVVAQYDSGEIPEGAVLVFDPNAAKTEEKQPA